MAIFVEFCDTDLVFDTSLSRIYWGRDSSYRWSEISTYTWDFGVLGSNTCSTGWEGELSKWEKALEYYELMGTY